MSTRDTIRYPAAPRPLAAVALIELDLIKAAPTPRPGLERPVQHDSKPAGLSARELEILCYLPTM